MRYSRDDDNGPFAVYCHFVAVAVVAVAAGRRRCRMPSSRWRASMHCPRRRSRCRGSRCERSAAAAAAQGAAGERGPDAGGDAGAVAAGDERT